MSLDVLVNQVAYSERKRVKTAIQSIVKHTKTLTPKIGSLVQNDGRVSRIIVLGGTIPIRYQGVQYNIPVEIYLGERFPAEPPRVFVRPTPNMSIKSNHKHVDLNGQVYLPSLNQWSYRSSLENMVDEASRVFSADPPLFSKPAAPAPASAAIAAASASAYPAAAVSATPYSAGAAGGSSATYSNPYIYGGSSSPSGIAAVSATSPTTVKVSTGTILNYVSTTGNPVSSSSSSPSFPSSSSSASSVSAREKEKRAKLIDEITMRLYQELHIVHVKLGEDLDKEFKDVAYLESSQKSAKEEIEETKALVEKLERAKTQVLDTKMKEVEEWAVAAAERDKLTAEERLAPSDDLSAQIVTLTAEIASYDDMIYFLERALVSSMNKTVDLPIFLKECRKIARKQFLAKAHLRKIHAVCIQDELQQQQRQQQQQTSAQYGSSMPTQQLYSNIYSPGHPQQQQDVYGGIPAVPGTHQLAGIPSGGSNIAAVMAASSYGRNV